MMATADRPEFPETRIAPALMLAQRVIDLFDQSGASIREQETALELAKTLVSDRWQQSISAPFES